MKCPHCNKEIEGKHCPECNSITPENSNYCIKCGTSFKEEEEKDDIVIEEDSTFDVEDRILCPDGTCTGIIENGKCVECGKGDPNA